MSRQPTTDTTHRHSRAGAKRRPRIISGRGDTGFRDARVEPEHDGEPRGLLVSRRRQQRVPDAGEPVAQISGARRSRAQRAADRLLHALPLRAHRLALLRQLDADLTLILDIALAADQAGAFQPLQQRRRVPESSISFSPSAFTIGPSSSHNASMTRYCG